MANEIHLALLREGLDAWQQWKENNPQVKPDLSGADLCRAYLNGANLSEANLIGANLSRATLSGADLSGATLSGADLSFATLWEANLSGAFLNVANLSKANLSEALLKGANLYQANLLRADLNGANLNGANFSGANLTDANLSRTQALNTNFQKVLLTGACLEGWSINSVTNLDNVNCEYVYLQVCQQSRNPIKGNFAPGDFIKLFQQVNQPIDLVFENGINWEACAYAFKQVEAEVQGLNLEILRIEKLEEGAIAIKVGIPAEQDRSKINHLLMQNYEKVHKAWQMQYHVMQNYEIYGLFDLINQLNDKLGKVIKIIPEAPKPEQQEQKSQKKL